MWICFYGRIDENMRLKLKRMYHIIVLDLLIIDHLHELVEYCIIDFKCFPVCVYLHQKASLPNIVNLSKIFFHLMEFPLNLEEAINVIDISVQHEYS